MEKIVLTDSAIPISLYAPRRIRRLKLTFVFTPEIRPITECKWNVCYGRT